MYNPEMFFRLNSYTLYGVEAKKVVVEVNLGRGLPAFTIVGLPETAVKESRERVETAIKNSGFSFPNNKRITVNLAPADIRKEGTALDLSIALGILAASGQISPENLERFLIIGELALDGELRGVRGALASSILAREEGLQGILCPRKNAVEASMVEVPVFPAGDLKEAVEILTPPLPQPFMIDRENIFRISSIYHIDFSDVKGQEPAKRAIEVAAAGGHNILMIGPPGSGKTMLARRIPTILPEMELEEAIESTKIHSAAGMLPSDTPIVYTRPFRAPHHTVSYAGLIGGGTHPKPGEVSLAHNGVLFLDELPEFRRDVLEVLRQPLEDGIVTVSRAHHHATFPARFMLVAAMNPCPCGYFGDPYVECTCTAGQIDRYVGKISGPLLDRIDIHIDVPRVKFEDLKGDTPSTSSKDMRERVKRAREIQKNRYRDMGISTNSMLTPKMMKEFCKLQSDAETILETAMKKFGFSARAYDRILKLSRTIADIDGSDIIKVEHVSEAVQYRTLDRKLWLKI